MVKHIVMFKLTEKNQHNMNEAIVALNSLRGNIESLKSLEIGTDFLCSERSYDIVLTAIFDNREGLKIYADHENHLPVVDKMRSLCSSSIVVDYEMT
ncbi:MAG: stress responsive protein [Nitrospinae bacterium CG22_combo_CG10-13_8_21_14_all_47_10]|nr:MAG: stress responsive protein [Nitrospinae bacterium CG22_combo_CG10-13_8_21_14_all_47_10]